MLENRWRNNFQELSSVSPGSCSKLANKSQGDLEPPELLLSTEEAGGNAGDSSEHLKPRLLLSERDLLPGRDQAPGVDPTDRAPGGEQSGPGSRS